MTLPVSQSAATTVSYKTVDGSAKAADNAYTAVAQGSLVIPAGQTTGQIKIDVDDGSGVANVGTETYHVELTSLTGGLTLSSTQSTATGQITVPGISGTVTDTQSKPMPTVAMALAGKAHSGKTVSRQLSSDQTGRYSVFVDPGSYKLIATTPKGRSGQLQPSSCPDGSQVPGGCQLNLKPGARDQIDFAPKARPAVQIVSPRGEPFRSPFVTTEHNPSSPYADFNGDLHVLHLNVGSQVAVKGTGFDPHGDPIKIFYDGTQVAKLGAARAFTKGITLDEPRRDCAAWVQAKQGKGKARAPVVLTYAMQVWAVSGHIQPDHFNEPLKHNEYLCTNAFLDEDLARAVPHGAGVMIDVPDIPGGVQPGGAPPTGRTHDGRWPIIAGGWDGQWLIVGRRAGAPVTFQGGVNSAGAVIHLPGATLTLRGRIQTFVIAGEHPVPPASGITSVLSYNDWLDSFLTDSIFSGKLNCHILPIKPPHNRVVLLAPADEPGCFRDAFAGGIDWSHGASVAGSVGPPPDGYPINPNGPLAHAPQIPSFVFGDHGIAINELSFRGRVALEAPSGSILLRSITAPARNSHYAWLDLGASGTVTIG